MSKQVDIKEINYEGNLIFPQTHEQAVIGLHDLLDTKANKDGFYESMGVGTAVNLTGQIERINDKTYRTSGGSEDIATGTARIEKVSGNTVVWNQLCDRCVSSQNGITVTTDDTTKIVTISGTTTATYFGLMSSMLGVLVANHKYILRCNVIKNTDGLNLKIVALNQKYIIDTPSNNVDFTKSYSYICHTTTESISLSNSWGMSVFGGAGTVFNDVQIQVMFSDLTLIYGEGNEPTTVEQFEADYQQWFGKPLTYEPYNEGELIPVKMTGLKTTGFNQWDEEWESGEINSTNGEKTPNSTRFRSKNYIPVISGATYYFNIGNRTVRIFQYDSNKNFLTEWNYSYSYKALITSQTFTLLNTCCYIAIVCADKSTYNNDICINLHWSGTKDGTYEPYEEHILPFDVTTLQGKLNGQGELVTPFADGLKKAGSVQDEIYYVGNKVFGVKRVGSVDLGTLTWEYVTEDVQYPFYRCGLTNPPIIKNNLIRFITAIYKSIVPITDTGMGALAEDKIVTTRYLAAGSVQLYIRNNDYTDATTFKTAMSGVMLYYELAEPLVYELEDVELPARFKVNDWGTEEQLHAEGVNSAPATLGVLYGVNAVDALRRMPTNYINKGSMENFLSAFSSATGINCTQGNFDENVEKYSYTVSNNSLIFVATYNSDTYSIDSVVGTFPQTSDVVNGKYKYYLSMDNAIIPLSISYTGSIVATGIYIAYGDTTPKLVSFSGAFDESIIGTQVTVRTLATL